jgi:transmembrane sensor
MEYASYGVPDFILDEYFQSWVLNPTTESEKFWVDWLAQHSYQREDIEKAVLLVKSLHIKREEAISDDEITNEWTKLKQDLRNEDATSGRTIFWRYGYQIAAAVALVLVSAGLFYYARYANASPQLYTTAYGETREIMLPDSSWVVLNANSALTLSENWESNQLREVWLKGEAFFKVRKKPNHTRFVVNANSVKIEVLGTRFNVNNRHDRTNVVLEEGKVRLIIKDKNDIIMRPGESVEVNAKRDLITQKAVKPQLYKAWVDKQVIFEGTPIREIAQQIEDTYGYKVVVTGDELSGKKLTGVLPAHDINILLKSLQATFNLQIDKQQDTIVIKRF